MIGLPYFRGMVFALLFAVAGFPADGNAEEQERAVLVSSIVIPEGAFLEAMVLIHFRVDPVTARRATHLSAQANAPGTVGFVASLEEGEGPKRFSGTLFTVVRSQNPVPGETRITVRDNYYVAAVELRA